MATRGVDAAIIAGYAALDPRVEGIAVYATAPSPSEHSGQARHHAVREARP